ncbi:MAG: hypothetical protein ACOY4R_21010 [Pseudomonadota bacterium]
MPTSARSRLLTVAVFAAGVVAVLIGGACSVWAWRTEDTALVFRIALPTLTAWLVLAMAHLAWKLGRTPRQAAPAMDWPDPLQSLLAAPKRQPDETVRRRWPDAQYCQQLELPPEPDTSWWLRRRRRRVALLIGLRDGSRHVRVTDASRPYRELPARRAGMAEAQMGGGEDGSAKGRRTSPSR